MFALVIILCDFFFLIYNINTKGRKPEAAPGHVNNA